MKINTQSVTLKWNIKSAAGLLLYEPQRAAEMRWSLGLSPLCGDSHHTCSRESILYSASSLRVKCSDSKVKHQKGIHQNAERWSSRLHVNLDSCELGTRVLLELECVWVEI